MKRLLVIVVLSLGLWLSVKGCWRFGVLSSYRNSLKATWDAAVLDQFGIAVPDAHVEVVHTYISTVPLSGAEIRRDEIKAYPKLDQRGRFSFQHPRNLTRGITVVNVRGEGFVNATLPIGAYNKDQIEGPPLWKIMLWKRLGVAPGQLGQIIDGGGNERVEMRPEWHGKPLLLDLKERRFVTEGGDFEFTIQRTVASDTQKEDEPFEIRVRAIGGVVHQCSREDYESMFSVGVPAWGEPEPVVLNGNGTRNHPNATLHCTFRMHDGRIHGRASFYFDLLGERGDEPLGPEKIRVNLQAFWTTGGSQVLREEP